VTPKYALQPERAYMQLARYSRNAHRFYRILLNEAACLSDQVRFCRGGGAPGMASPTWPKALAFRGVGSVEKYHQLAFWAARRTGGAAINPG